MLPQRANAEVANQLAVDQDFTAIKFIETGEQIDEGGFARAGGADERDGFAGPRVEGDVGQRRQLAAITKAYATKLDFAANISGKGAAAGRFCG